MYTIIFKNRMKSMISFGIVLMISFGVFLQGCTSELVFDDDILNSPELEEYIIAGADYKKSLDSFNSELCNIDLSKLIVSYDKDGRKIMSFPASSFNSFEIKEKYQVFREKRETLISKFPEFTTFRENVSAKYFNHSIQISSNIQIKFLDLGIKTSRYLLKNGSYEVQFYNQWNHFMGQLYSWMFMPDYVEVLFIAFKDGTYAIVKNSEAGTYWSRIQGVSNCSVTGNVLFEGKPVSWLGHTHISYPTPSTPDDYNFRDKYSGADHYIFHDGTFYNY